MGYSPVIVVTCICVLCGPTIGSVVICLTHFRLEIIAGATLPA